MRSSKVRRTLYVTKCLLGWKIYDDLQSPFDFYSVPFVARISYVVQSVVFPMFSLRQTQPNNWLLGTHLYYANLENPRTELQKYYVLSLFLKQMTQGTVEHTTSSSTSNISLVNKLLHDHQRPHSQFHRLLESSIPCTAHCVAYIVANIGKAHYVHTLHSLCTIQNRF